MPTPDPDRVTTLGAAGSPGVLLLHPWWGVTPAVMWWADQLVAAGRRVLVPDLYGGVTVATEEEAEARADATIQNPDALALIERCADDLASTVVPWAAMGFSMGAFLACGLAGRGSDGPEQLILFYGGRPPAGDVQTRRADLHVAPADPWFEDDELAAVEAGLRAGGVAVTVHTYDGCGHWFAEAGSPGYDEGATALARDRVVDGLRAPAG